MAPANNVPFGDGSVNTACDLHHQRQTGAVSVSGTPIATLITTLRSCKAFAMDKAYANKLIAPLVTQLDQADQDLQKLLAKFGWVGDGFSHVLDLRGLQAALQKYQYVAGAFLGNGAYGAVHRVFNRETGEPHALKRVVMTERGLCEATIREVSTLRELHHCNIVKLRDVIANVHSRYCYLVLELLDTDLFSFLYGPPKALDMRVIKSIMFQVLSGLRHAHHQSIMHRDLKPQNILIGFRSQQQEHQRQQHQRQQLVPEAAAAAPAAAPAAAVHGCGCCAAPTGDGPAVTAEVNRLCVKIADFGLARPYLPSVGPDAGAYTHWVVTLFYRAPELLLGCDRYGPEVDIWSAGCVLGELLNVGPLFSAASEIAQLQDIFAKMGTPLPAELPALAGVPVAFERWEPTPLGKLVPRLADDRIGQDLLARMLSYDPRRRITASQALMHRWFDDIREQELAAAAAEDAAVAAAAAAQRTE